MKISREEAERLRRAHDLWPSSLGFEAATTIVALYDRIAELEARVAELEALLEEDAE